MSCDEGSSEGTRRILAGRHSLPDFVRAVKSTAVNGQELNERSLIQTWQAARNRLSELDSAGARSSPLANTKPLPPEGVGFAAQCLAVPALQRTYRLLPFSCEMVELGRLVPWQNYVDVNFARSLTAAMSPVPDTNELLRFAFGVGREEAPLLVTGPAGNHATCCSLSSDIRVLDVRRLDPATVRDQDLPGGTRTVIAICIGHSANSMCAVSWENRLVLINGTHHAFALIERGIAWSPCLIWHVASRSELDLTGVPARFSQPFEWFFTAARPPLFADFLDQSLILDYPVERRSHVLAVELKFEHSVIATP